MRFDTAQQFYVDNFSVLKVLPSLENKTKAKFVGFRIPLPWDSCRAFYSAMLFSLFRALVLGFHLPWDSCRAFYSAMLFSLFRALVLAEPTKILKSDIIYPSPSSMSIPVRPPDVGPTPSPPWTEARPSSSHVNAREPSPVPASTPSPSSVNARGLSSVPISTPSPSPPVSNMPTDEDAINLAMEDPPPLIIVLWLH
ncbi:hypothetical protein JHK85_007053 [Glycine max]|nr:hypothetical protein JHK85_007053 [Glycine max]